MENGVRVAVLSNVNLDLLNQSLAGECSVFQQDGYGQWIQNILDPGKLAVFNPNIIFLVLDGYALFEAAKTADDIQAEADACLGFVDRLASNHPSVPVFVANIDISPKQIAEGDKLRPEHAVINLWEQGVAKCVSAHSNLHLFHLRTLIENIGRANFYSDKMWYMGSIPYSLKGIAAIKEEILFLAKKQKTIRKKVLVLDLDNTLWGGVIGEDGVEGIKLSYSLIGAAYRDAQLRIKELAKAGVILAVVSKNNMEDVQNAFRSHPQMALTEDDFVDICANWNPKPQNIADLAEKLNLGLDSFVFLDDNPVEREAVKLTLPDVTVAEFPKDISKLPNTINDIAREYFYTARLTKEDLKKTEQYQQEAKRQKALTTAASLDDYLISLQIEVTLQEVTDAQLERVAQLTQKTNQFTLLTERFTTEQLIEYRADKNNHVYVANVSDRFGDSGLVFVLMVSTKNDTAHIDNLLMSCRVMGRTIEDTIINAVEQKLLANGIKQVKATYRKTKKNSPVVTLMERLGYDIVGSENDEVKHYLRKIAGECPPRTLLFEPIWR